MSRRSTSSRIAVGIELRQIRLNLTHFGTPTIELEGTIVDTQNRRAAQASSVVVRTLHMTPEAEAFIASMREAFRPARTEGPTNG